ncbi:major facilitator superfamily domain-containing protein, partial [Mycena rebaudengoi]
KYYRCSELVMRIGIFFGISAPLSGAFGGLLASGLLHIGDIGTVKSWLKIFLVEGIITTVIGLICFIIIPTDPARTRMLNEDERALALARIDADQALALARIDADQAVRTYGKKEPTSLKLILRSFNINTTVCLLCYIMANISFQGLSLFIPTVVATRSLSIPLVVFQHTDEYSRNTVVESQLRTVPPYVVGAIWAVVNSYISLRVKQRTGPILSSGILMVLGYAIAGELKFSLLIFRYAACFLSIAGGSVVGPLFLAWGTNN